MPKSPRRTKSLQLKSNPSPEGFYSYMLILHLSPGRAIITWSVWTTDNLPPAPSGDTWRTKPYSNPCHRWRRP
ncbi:hypothetical protein EA835_27370, partial [Klebsiella pneumoniae]